MGYTCERTKLPCPASSKGCIAASGGEVVRRLARQMGETPQNVKKFARSAQQSLSQQGLCARENPQYEDPPTQLGDLDIPLIIEFANC